MLAAWKKRPRLSRFQFALKQTRGQTWPFNQRDVAIGILRAQCREQALAIARRSCWIGRASMFGSPVPTSLLCPGFQILLFCNGLVRLGVLKSNGVDQYCVDLCPRRGGTNNNRPTQDRAGDLGWRRTRLKDFWPE